MPVNLLRQFPAKSTNVSLLLAVILAIGLAGCLTEDQTEPAAEPPVSLPPTEPQPSADDAVSAFRNAYANRDFESYRALLHPDYYFTFTTRGWPHMPVEPITYYLDRASDLQITAHLFSGEPMQNYTGETVPGIEQIVWHRLTPVGSWTQDWEAWPVTRYRRLFQIKIEFRTRAGHSLFVYGHHMFVVAQTRTTIDGQTREFWQIHEMNDRIDCDDKDPSCVTWADLKLMYCETLSP